MLNYFYRSVRPKPRTIKQNTDPNWSDDPEVKSELEAMRSTVPRTYNLRLEGSINTRL